MVGAQGAVPTRTHMSLPTDVSGYSSSLREALVPLVADHKCSSPEVYGADISPNMLCAGYFDCKSDACQVSQPQTCMPWGSRPARRASGGQGRQHMCPPSLFPTTAGGAETPLTQMGTLRPREGQVTKPDSSAVRRGRGLAM